jgi:hypothetical protein
VSRQIEEHLLGHARSIRPLSRSGHPAVWPVGPVDTAMIFGLSIWNGMSRLARTAAMA